MSICSTFYSNIPENDEIKQVILQQLLTVLHSSIIIDEKMSSFWSTLIEVDIYKTKFTLKKEQTRVYLKIILLEMVIIWIPCREN